MMREVYIYIFICSVTYLPFFQRPNMQTPQAQPIRVKGSKKITTSKSEKTSDLTKVAASDPRNNGYPPEAHMFFPESGQCYISLKKQPPVLCRIINETNHTATIITLFQDAFPESKDQRHYISLAFATACDKYKLPTIADRFEKDDKFKDLIIACVSNRLSTLRGRVKEAAEKIVPARYELFRVDTPQRAQLVKDLIKACCYVFPLADVRCILLSCLHLFSLLPEPMNTMTWRSNQPYQHPAVHDVLKHAFWTDSQNHVCLGKRLVDTFSSSVDHDDAKEVPMAMIGLVSVAIFATLREYSTGSQVKQTFDSAIMRTEYLKHIRLMEDRIIGQNGNGRNKYHNMASRLYQELMKDTNSASAEDLPVIDVDNME
ncbi:hypothetical protein VKT23_006593 [Stygiomarasmius scandens]|uniref:DUF6532 domain-containing protein n=1 Tax=Marasmiellus scandens TaxID=2682957 RepID=A0ABR1JUJ6_9AGAR